MWYPKEIVWVTSSESCRRSLFYRHIENLLCCKAIQFCIAVAYSYLYVKSKNGALCFDSNESSMKVTATGCCLPKKVTLSSSGVINVGESHCYGKGDSSGLKNGDSLKVLKKGMHTEISRLRQYLLITESFRYFSNLFVIVLLDQFSTLFDSTSSPALSVKFLDIRVL